MVKMIVGPKLAEKSRYRTRRLTAGDEVEMSPRKARLYRTLGYVTPAPVEPARGRPRKEEAPAPQPAAPDDLDDLTNAELMERARERGLDLPSGYIPNQDLIDRLRGE